MNAAAHLALLLLPYFQPRTPDHGAMLSVFREVFPAHSVLPQRFVLGLLKSSKLTMKVITDTLEKQIDLTIVLLLLFLGMLYCIYRRSCLESGKSRRLQSFLFVVGPEDMLSPFHC